MGFYCLKDKGPLRGEETIYFLPLSLQKFLALIWSTSEELKAEMTLEPLNGFEHGTPGLEIQRLHHYSP